MQLSERQNEARETLVRLTGMSRETVDRFADIMDQRRRYREAMDWIEAQAPDLIAQARERFDLPDL